MPFLPVFSGINTFLYDTTLLKCMYFPWIMEEALGILGMERYS